MKVVRVHTLLTDLEPLMEEVEVMTGGYLTEEQTIYCQRLELLGTPAGEPPVKFYVDENDRLFAFHYARRLDLQKAICAVDYFPHHCPGEVSKVSGLLLAAIRK
ncbi:hypothetical protein [Rufibacter psychrotolerans]|uniref:hypothetical protein n=1 Tax=Rufibacter psychrotolerans TaxID=2812556 RepID=UPI001967041D|nr:hypothetical protein [Rufibacter sp. SYSU D00308]